MSQKAIIFILAVLFIHFNLDCNGAVGDTILNAVYSKPFFYNVLKDQKGVVYAGTSEGVYTIEGSIIGKLNDNDGYVSLDKNGNLTINPEGIRNYKESKYLHLLPYPEFNRDEYHTGTDEYFYVCSGGRIYIFDIVPYLYEYPFHSIRSISENFVGTYSGIYLKGIKLGPPAPLFTDGYIREYDNRAFICYDAALILEPQVLKQGFISNAEKETRVVSSYKKVQYRDILKSPGSGKFFLSSITDMLIMDSYAGEARAFYTSKSKNGDLSIIGESRNSLFFSDGSYLVDYNIGMSVFDTVARFTEPILDGSINNRHTFILTENNIWVINTDNTIEKLAAVTKAHTMEMISNTDIIISTNNGLFRLNTLTRVLSTLISGIEFNRRALFIKDNIIKAGSINGLYTINVNDLDILTAKNHSGIKDRGLPFYFFAIILIVFLFITVLVIGLAKMRKKLNNAELMIKELNVHNLDREKIENYIRENLSVASLKSIIEHFNTSKSQIYNLTEPETPGSIIQKMRLEKVIEMRDSGKDVTEISSITGLSESYIKKIKGKALY